MNKNIFIVILIAVIGIGIYFSLNSSDKAKKIYQQKIDSIQQINKDLIDQREILKDEVIDLNVEQEDLEKLADSLHKEAQKPIPCEYKVIIQEKEIKSLRGALKKCKEIKTIQTTTIGICDTLLINYELIEVSYNKIIKAQKKNIGYLYMETSVFPAIERYELGLDYIIKNKFIIGASVSYDANSSRSYTNLKIGYKIF